MPLIATVLFLLACGGRDPPVGIGQDGGVPAARSSSSAMDALHSRVAAIDGAMAGSLGVYVKDLRTGDELEYNADRPWYLSSTIKVPVAIAVLAQVEAGALDLQQTLELKESDFVDGAGRMLFEEPGTRHGIADLLRRSIVESDSTATDMLLREVGERQLQRSLARWATGFGTITPILDVRYAVYGQLHPGVANLGNRQLVSLRQAEAGEPRLAALAQLLGVERSELGNVAFDDLFESYYATGANSASLTGFGRLLERLARGELLEPSNGALLLDHMRVIETGSRRIQAGLPAGFTFAQKTGTQIQRACNVGIVERNREPRLIVAACAERFGDLRRAEQSFRQLGDALGPLLADGTAE